MPPRLFDRFFEVYFLLWRSLFAPSLTCWNRLSVYRYCCFRTFTEGRFVVFATPMLLCLFGAWGRFQELPGFSGI